MARVKWLYLLDTPIAPFTTHKIISSFIYSFNFYDPAVIVEVTHWYSPLHIISSFMK